MRKKKVYPDTRDRAVFNKKNKKQRNPGTSFGNVMILKTGFRFVIIRLVIKVEARIVKSNAVYEGDRQSLNCAKGAYAEGGCSLSPAWAYAEDAYDCRIIAVS